MQKIVPMTGVILFFFSFAAAFGQEKQTDARRTAEEQFLFEQSIPANPAKIPEATLIDPRMGKSNAAADPVIWKPVNAAPAEREKVVPAKNLTPLPANEKTKETRKIKDAELQPEASLPSGKIINYSNIKGSNAQPEGMKTDKIMNYRTIKGSKLQPETESPKR